MSCARCIALEAENRRLKAQLGIHVSKDAAELLRDGLGVSLQQACLIAALHTFNGRAMGSWALIDALLQFYPYKRSDDAVIRVQLSRIRSAMGADFIETVLGVGYALTASARARCDGLLQAQQVAA